MQYNALRHRNNLLVLLIGTLGTKLQCKNVSILSNQSNTQLG